jgi:hypothetical protein
MLGIMARAAEKVVQLYRSENLLLDLFGQRDGAVALTTIDDKNIFGSNSTSPTYTDADREAAKDLRDKLVTKYPDAMRADNVGYTPNNALFHAETNAASSRGEWRHSGGPLFGYLCRPEIVPELRKGGAPRGVGIG